MADELTPQAIHDDVRAILTQVKTGHPLVHCLTNNVVKQVTANALLAAGAAPAMVEDAVEAGEFAHVASGVLVNVGTLTPDIRQAMTSAVSAAQSANTPWVLDPVAVGGLSVRTQFARSILDSRPAAIRGNPSEIAALAGTGSGGRGVDSTDSVEAVTTIAAELSHRSGAVVAASGPTDLVVSTVARTHVTGGHPMLQQVIGTGCALGALTAATLGVAQLPAQHHAAVVASHALVSAAGTVAGQTASAPGHFAVAWLDALHTLSADDVLELITLDSEQA
ncbi:MULTISPECIES: hydroxyethylthiazole kinase [Auritidibacter]|uniref:hydroxyethylthiazole kinase n=1 Tax=Auritidibacter TaxID=1160973 RepID=UPI0016B3D3CF|nr:MULTISPECIES: hydroxyethylthiazole kinase [Auritidibacter]NIH72339.1 hydroxyethylthiazole kinase [Auritidibacter ignavus]WGH82416.1 hydroxyethylthiazole kinase [Auritidibacter ignavus]